MNKKIRNVSIVGMILVGTFFILEWAFQSSWNINYIIFGIIFYIIFRSNKNV